MEGEAVIFSARGKTLLEEANTRGLPPKSDSPRAEEDALPADVLLRIFAFLSSPFSRSSFASVCRCWRDAILRQSSHLPLIAPPLRRSHGLQLLLHTCELGGAAQRRQDFNAADGSLCEEREFQNIFLEDDVIGATSRLQIFQDLSVLRSTLDPVPLGGTRGTGSEGDRWHKLDEFILAVSSHRNLRCLDLSTSGKWEEGDGSTPPPQHQQTRAVESDTWQPHPSSSLHRPPLLSPCHPLLSVFLSCTSLVEVKLDASLCAPSCRHSCSECCLADPVIFRVHSRYPKLMEEKTEGIPRDLTSQPLEEASCCRAEGSPGSPLCRLLPAHHASSLSQLHQLRSLRILKPLFQFHSLEPLSSLSTLSSLQTPIHPLSLPFSSPATWQAMRALSSLRVLRLWTLCTGHWHGGILQDRQLVEDREDNKEEVSSPRATKKFLPLLSDLELGPCTPTLCCGLRTAQEGQQEAKELQGEWEKESATQTREAAATSPSISPRDFRGGDLPITGRQGTQGTPKRQGTAKTGDLTQQPSVPIQGLLFCLLPSSFSLRRLTLTSLPTLLSLPSSLCSLPLLHSLVLVDLPLLHSLPQDLPSLSSLTSLSLSSLPALSSLPPTLGKLSKLTSLFIARCPNLSSLPESIGYAASLRVISLRSLSSLSSLPFSFNALSSLRTLSIHQCGVMEVRELRMSRIPGLGIETRVNRTNGASGVGIEGSLEGLVSLETLNLGLTEFQKVPESLGLLPSLASLSLETAGPWVQIPESAFLFYARHSLKELKLLQYNMGNYLPLSFSILTALTSLHVVVANYLHTFARTLTALPSLAHVSLQIQSFNIFPVHVQALLSGLGSLAHLEIIDGRDSLESNPAKLALVLPSLPGLVSLKCKCFWIQLCNASQFPNLKEMYISFMDGEMKGRRGDNGGYLLSEEDGSTLGQRSREPKKREGIESGLVFDKQLGVVLQFPALQSLILRNVPLSKKPNCLPQRLQVVKIQQR